MSSFIQITDPHIVAKGALVCGRSDTAPALRLAVAPTHHRPPPLAAVTCAI